MFIKKLIERHNINKELHELHETMEAMSIEIDELYKKIVKTPSDNKRLAKLEVEYDYMASLRHELSKAL